MGVPEMEKFWNDLTKRYDDNKLNKHEKELFKKLVKTLGFLESNPRHTGLQTHPHDGLSDRYGFKVWQSYLENDTSGARRLFWTYGPGRMEISILGIEPHPNESHQSAYERIQLSKLPPQGKTTG
jgi:hypothetical protein